MNRPHLFMPTLMPMGTSMQHVVMSAGGGIFTSTAMGQPITLSAGTVPVLPTEHVPHSQPVAMVAQPVRPQRTVPKADLYLCKTANNASGTLSVNGTFFCKDKLPILLMLFVCGIVGFMRLRFNYEWN